MIVYVTQNGAMEIEWELLSDAEDYADFKLIFDIT